MYRSAILMSLAYVARSSSSIGPPEYALVLLQLFLEKSNEARITLLRHCPLAIA